MSLCNAVKSDKSKELVSCNHSSHRALFCQSLTFPNALPVKCPARVSPFHASLNWI